MLLIGVNRSPHTRRVAMTLRHYGVPYEQRDLSGFGNRAEVRAANPLGRIPAMKSALAAVEGMVDPSKPYLLFGRLTQADICSFIAERLARGLKIDTASEMPRLHMLAKRLLEQTAFSSSEP